MVAKLRRGRLVSARNRFPYDTEACSAVILVKFREPASSRTEFQRDLPRPWTYALMICATLTRRRLWRSARACQ